MTNTTSKRRGDEQQVLGESSPIDEEPKVGMATRRRLLVLSDTCALTAAFLGAEGLYRLYTSSTGGLSVAAESVVFLATLPAWVVLATGHALYRNDQERTSHSTADEVTEVIHLVTLGAWFLFLAGLLTNRFAVDPSKLALFWTLAIPFLIAGRLGVRAVSRRAEWSRQRLVVVGAGAATEIVAQRVNRHPEYGLDLVGVVDIGRDGVDTLTQRRLEATHPDRVVIVPTDSPAKTVSALVDVARAHGWRADIVPHAHEVVGPGTQLYSLEGLPLMGIGPRRHGRAAWGTKRAIDIVGASVLLCLTCPLWAWIAFRIWRDSGRPVFFRQTRLGKHQRSFTALKFRTMTVGADPSAHAAYIRQALGEGVEAGPGGLYKLDRPEVTTVGVWLRRSSLDELPQLLNVLRGDMSLVGPRPCLDYEAECFDAAHLSRFEVKPGLTGYWQVLARANSSPREALDMDATYVWNWSLGLDLVLLMRTPLALLRQRRRTR